MHYHISKIHSLPKLICEFRATGLLPFVHVNQKENHGQIKCFILLSTGCCVGLFTTINPTSPSTIGGPLALLRPPVAVLTLAGTRPFALIGGHLLAVRLLPPVWPIPNSALLHPFLGTVCGHALRGFWLGKGENFGEFLIKNKHYQISGISTIF